MVSQRNQQLSARLPESKNPSNERKPAGEQGGANGSGLKININKKGQQVFTVKKNNLAPQINANQIQLSNNNLAQLVQNQKRAAGGGSSSQNFRLSIRPPGAAGVTGNGPITPSGAIQKI